MKLLKTANLVAQVGLDLIFSRIISCGDGMRITLVMQLR